MNASKLKARLSIVVQLLSVFILLTTLSAHMRSIGYAAESKDAPAPLLEKGHAVSWWLVFKFNSAIFSGCGGASRVCLFGGTEQNYKVFGQQFVYASNENPSLQKGSD